MGQLFSVLLLVGFVGAYFKWIAAAVAAYLAGGAVSRGRGTARRPMRGKSSRRRSPPGPTSSTRGRSLVMTAACTGTTRRCGLRWIGVANERLFDEGPRSDSSPGAHLEKSFHFLNRRAGAFWDWVRSRIEDCYAAFPDEHKSDLAGRLRDDDERQHLPAWWELYTFTLFDRLGYRVEVHPELEGSPTRPDFLVTRGPVSMYVEAAVVFNGLENSDAWNWVCDRVNDAKIRTSWLTWRSRRKANSVQRRERSSIRSRNG